MSTSGLFCFLSRYSADKLILAAISSAVYLFALRKRVRGSLLSASLPFAIGAALYLVWGKLFGSVDTETAIDGAVSAGGLTAVICALFGGLKSEKSAETDGEENALATILSAYVPFSRLAEAEAARPHRQNERGKKSFKS